MATRAKRVDEALRREGFRYLFDAIDDNCREVVMWRGGGIPVGSVREALRLAREIQAAEEAERAQAG